MTGAEEELAAALAELREALDTLRRAGAWDAPAASRALKEAEARVGHARRALERALREARNGAQG